MKITPVEIKKQEFKKTMRGYDSVEVDTFLDMLGGEFEQLINENNDLSRRALQLETELKNFKEVERTLRQTLMNVQETSTKSRENSKKEADLIKKEAEISASETVEAARHETRKLAEELMALKSQKNSLISRLRHILSSHLELLEVLELDEDEIGKLKDRTKKQFTGTKKTVIPEIKTSPVKPAEKAPAKKENASGIAAVTNDENDKEKPRGPDLFKDIFGDSADMDDFIKS